MIYPEEDFLQLSGLQHFKFCRRQWALIYIENQWAENFRTTDGAILHENAHNGGFTESRGDLLVTRDMRIFSRTLGVSGACDVLEFRRGKTGIPQGVRGLKSRYDRRLPLIAASRTPQGVRGLKCGAVFRGASPGPVAPRKGCVD